MLNFVLYDGDLLYYKPFNPYTFKEDYDSTVHEIPPLYQFKKNNTSKLVFLLSNEERNCRLTNFNKFPMKKQYTDSIVQNLIKKINEIDVKTLEFKCIIEDGLLYFPIIKKIIEGTSISEYIIHTNFENLTNEMKSFIEEQNIGLIYHCRNTERDIPIIPLKTIIYDTSETFNGNLINLFPNTQDIIPIFNFNNTNATILSSIRKYYSSFQKYIMKNDDWKKIISFNEIYQYAIDINKDTEYMFSSNSNKCYLHNEESYFMDGSERYYYCDSFKKELTMDDILKTYSSIKTRCSNCPVISLCKCLCSSCSTNKVGSDLKCFCDYYKYLAFLMTFFYKEKHIDIKRIEGNYYYRNF